MLRLRLMLRPTMPSMVTILLGTVDIMDTASSTARGVLMLMPMLRLRPRLMLRLTMLCTATTLLGTMATMDTASSTARGALTLMPKPRLRLRLMLRLRPTTLSTATTPLDVAHPYINLYGKRSADAEAD